MKQANDKDKLRRPMTVQNNEDDDYADDKFEKAVEVKKAVFKNESPINDPRRLSKFKPQEDDDYELDYEVEEK